MNQPDESRPRLFGTVSRYVLGLLVLTAVVLLTLRAMRGAKGRLDQFMLLVEHKSPVIAEAMAMVARAFEQLLRWITLFVKGMLVYVTVLTLRQITGFFLSC